MRNVNPAASDSPPPIGAKLRAARQAQHLTLDVVAKQANLTKGYISRVERDDTSPSVASLMSICQVLGLSLGQLFEEPDSAIVRFDDAPLINLGGTGAVEHMVTPRGQSQVQVIHSEIASGAHGGENLYTINCKVESLHIIRGELHIRFAASSEVLYAGDTITFPGNEPHSWWAPVESAALWVLVPAPWSGLV
ncbi:helix-turn-helix domain-containing protein [Nesterenkonia sp. LB17]|uniref:helix-turn-helix domain-containing protein n=1 Tax=unclassified Nesterenkonia TaxID=2629769 RepID=UPI001F4C5854|nr:MULTISPECIES: helix-turn-helix domain-containing protein [unclassified Nesterenkonia]MCH8561560.1 helix-turn-helix domain-containing protein [Nesterenkonia sp. DZ6]MCH8566325.1 helix-turn-helix domain-containing protein [Nesterenkonia sp. LB17]